MNDILGKFIDLFQEPIKRYEIRHSSLDNFGTACMVGGSAYSAFLSSKIDENRVMDIFVAHVERNLKERDAGFESVVTGDGRCPLEVEDMLANKQAKYWATFEVLATKSQNARYLLFYTNNPAFFRMTMLDAVDAARAEVSALEIK